MTRQIVWVLVASLLLGFGELHAGDVTGSLPGVDATSSVGSAAEWEQAESILMHTPGNELFLGVIHLDAALFEKPFSIDQAAVEHRQYIRTLEEHGVKVSTVVDTLLEGTLDEDGQVIEGAPLVELHDFAKRFITFDTTGLSVDGQHEQENYLNKVIEGLHSKELVRIILEQPVVHLRKSGTNTGYVATYSLRPVMNLYFTRDQDITMEKGVVLNKVQSQQRASETEIIRFVLEKLGVTPIAEIEGEGEYGRRALHCARTQ